MKATIDGVGISYELIGDGPQLWVITPGGRFSKDAAGVRELADVLAASGRRALIWDRPNCGESDVCFTGSSESVLHADALLGLLRHLDLGPAVLMGGSAGSRVSLLAAAVDPSMVAGLALLWVSGGIFGLMTLANFYCGNTLRTAWSQGMDAVVDLPEWAEVVRRNPTNRDRILEQDRQEFVATFERWMGVYYPRDGEVVPGLTAELASSITMPTLVYRSGESDCFHPRRTSEALADVLPNSRLIEPPWPDTEWRDGQQRRASGAQQSPWQHWPQLAPSLLAWADDVF